MVNPTKDGLPMFSEASGDGSLTLKSWRLLSGRTKLPHPTKDENRNKPMCPDLWRDGLGERRLKTDGVTGNEQPV